MYHLLVWELQGTVMTEYSEVESSFIDYCETVQAGVLAFETEVHYVAWFASYSLCSFSFCWIKEGNVHVPFISTY